MYVYKVCNVIDNQYKSLIHNQIPEFSLTYSLYKTIVPETGRIFAYASANPINWSEFNYNRSVLLCMTYGDVKLVDSVYSFTRIFNYYCPKELKRFWKEYESKKDREDIGHIALCAGVQPIKVLSKQDIDALIDIHS